MAKPKHTFAVRPCKACNNPYGCEVCGCTKCRAILKDFDKKARELRPK